jgi:hypothetical protein
MCSGLPDSIDSAISLPSSMQPRDLERGDAPRTSAERRRRQRYESDDDDDDHDDHDHDRTGKRRDDDRAGGDSSDDDDGGPTKRVKRVAWALWDSLLGHDDGQHRPNANSDDEDPGLSTGPTCGHKTLERQGAGKAAAAGVSDLKSADRASTEWRDLLLPLKMTKDHPMHGRHRRSYDTLPLPAPTTEPDHQHQQEQQTSPGHHHHYFDDKHNSGVHDSSLVAGDDAGGGGHHLLVQHYHHRHHDHHRNLSLPAVLQRPLA